MQNREQVVADARLVVIHITGRKYRDFSRRALTVADLMASARGGLSAKRAGAVGRQLALRMDADCLFHERARGGIAVDRVHNLATTGMAASLPMASVAESSRSRSFTSPFLNLTALARSIRCGKSTFQGCGGTYGHFVM